MTVKTIGTCGNCGGPITVPMFWGGPTPAPAHCDWCGARPKRVFGPEFEMEPSGKRGVNSWRGIE